VTRPAIHTVFESIEREFIMNHTATATFDTGDARGPGHWLLGAAVRALHALTGLITVRLTPREQDDAAAVRALAHSMQRSDPGFAADLYAAAARYEAERDTQTRATAG
jgi:hypothetical protein